MVRRRLAPLLALLLLLAAAPAQAARFGTSEELHFIQDVGLKGAKGERLYLAEKVSIKNFIGGYSMSRDGYVLGISGQYRSYYPMPTSAELGEFQASGLLPKPLPRYEYNFFDYLEGYSLWAILGTVALWTFLKKTFGKE